MTNAPSEVARATQSDAMLRGVRAVHLLLTRERDADVLVRKATAALADALGFSALCIVRTEGDDRRQLVACGDGPTVAPLEQRLDGSELTACLRAAIATGETIVHEARSGPCTDCPLAECWGQHDGVAVPIEHDGRRFGGLLVRLAAGAAAGGVEVALLEELADDLALGLRRIEIDAELRASERCLRALFEQAPVGVAQCDSRTLRFLRVNPAYCEIVGRSEEEMLGLASDEITHPDDVAADHEALAELRAGVTPSYARAKRYLLPDGSTVWVELVISRMWGEEEAPTSHIAVVKDVTARVRAEAELAEHHTRVRELSSRLERALEDERGRIAADLHDHVGQLVVACQLKVGALCRAAPPEPCKGGLEALAALLQQASERLGQITFELSSATLHLLGFEAAVEELCERTEERFGLRCALERSGRGDVEVPKALAPIVFRALRELVLNAVKHAGASRIEVALARAPALLEVTVDDDGRGFDVHAVAHARGGHRGFGLFSIRERLSEIGAEVRLESTPGAGTRATLHVPWGREGGLA